VHSKPTYFPGIAELGRGEPVDEKPLYVICDFVDQRPDCADFRMVGILRLLFDYQDRLSTPAIKRLEQTVLNFKYWIDEPGTDSMCYWSENHQLLFAAAEYLAGKLYGDAVFTNSGLTGEAHRLKAEKRLNLWFEARLKFGFVEWHSNTYYLEDIAPLSLLADCAGDSAMIRRAEMTLDLIFLDMALHNYRGFFCASSGRCYEAAKKNPRRQSVDEALERAFGFGNVKEYNYSRISADFLVNRRYTVPGVLREIAHYPGPLETRCGMGLEIKETDAVFKDDYDNKGLYLWSMESLTEPETIAQTMEMFNRWDLKNNSFMKGLSCLNHPLLRRSGLLPLLVKILNPVTRGMGIRRVNTYTLRRADYLLSTAQAYRPGGFGDQQHIWQATVGGGVTVFTTHPGNSRGGAPAGNQTPGYWVGSGILPHAVQHKNVLLCLYDLRVRRGFLEGKRRPFTHAWFPEGQFDEAVIEDRLAAGRAGNGYIALISTGLLEKGEENELIQRGKLSAWAALLGSAGENGGFQSFLKQARAARLSLKKGIRPPMDTLTLTALGHRYVLRFGADFQVDGSLQNMDYPLLDCQFVHAERGSGLIEVRCGGSFLTINLKTGERIQGKNP
jgi:hypothetical protein